MRLTRAGAGVTISALLCFAIGRLFGADELLYLAAMQFGALLVSVLLTATARLDLAVSRTAHPARLRSGTPARVDVRIDNRARRSTPMLHATDHISGTPGASLHLAPIRGGESTSIAYRLRPSLRATYRQGRFYGRYRVPIRARLAAAGIAATADSRTGRRLLWLLRRAPLAAVHRRTRARWVWVLGQLVGERIGGRELREAP